MPARRQAHLTENAIASSIEPAFSLSRVRGALTFPAGCVYYEFNLSAESRASDEKIWAQRHGVRGTALLAPVIADKQSENLRWPKDMRRN
jgi:hypothetical protein